METLTISQLFGTNVKVGNAWYFITNEGKWQFGKQRTIKPVQPLKITTAQMPQHKSKVLRNLIIIISLILVCGIVNSIQSEKKIVIHKHLKHNN